MARAILKTPKPSKGVPPPIRGEAPGISGLCGKVEKWEGLIEEAHLHHPPRQAVCVGPHWCLGLPR